MLRELCEMAKVASSFESNGNPMAGRIITSAMMRIAQFEDEPVDDWRSEDQSDMAAMKPERDFDLDRLHEDSLVAGPEGDMEPDDDEWLDDEDGDFEDDGQPTMYEEYQDLYGGDDGPETHDMDFMGDW